MQCAIEVGLQHTKAADFGSSAGGGADELDALVPVAHAAGLSVIGAVVSEFVAAERGLGYLIYTSTAYFHVSIGFGAMIVLSLIGLALFQSVQLLERWLFPWAVAQAPETE